MTQENRTPWRKVDPKSKDGEPPEPKRPMIRGRKKHREAADFSLNITSLMDVLTVLLFFLLKSFSVTDSALSVPQGIRLPSSATDARIEETVTLALLKDQIQVSGQSVMKLDRGKPYIRSRLRWADHDSPEKDARGTIRPQE